MQCLSWTLLRAFRPLATVATLLALHGGLNVADLYLTWRLLRHSEAYAREVNPLAGWLLRESGWAGLATFKLGAALATAALFSTITIFRPRLGRAALAVACATTGLVVGYSLVLNLQAAAHAADLRALRRMLEKGGRFAVEFREIAERREYTERLAEDFLRGRCTFAEAVGCLERDFTRRPAWIGGLRRLFPDMSDAERATLQFLRAALRREAGDPWQLTAERRAAAARRWAAVCAAHLGRPAPPAWWRLCGVDAPLTFPSSDTWHECNSPAAAAVQ